MCCLDDAPSLYPYEIRKLSQHIKMNPEEFKRRYTKESTPPEPPETRKMTTPCPFLTDNKCSVYSVRPEICITYPFVLSKSSPSSYHIMFTAKHECELAQQIMAAYADFCKHTGGLWIMNKRALLQRSFYDVAGQKMHFTAGFWMRMIWWVSLSAWIRGCHR